MIEFSRFGTTPSGDEVCRYTLFLPNGTSAAILSWGATLHRMRVPDARGEIGDVVLGYRDLDTYVRAHGRMGATMGRFANRIGGATFRIDGEEYHLTANEGTNSIHGGPEGFDRRIWSVSSVIDSVERPEIEFSIVSPAGDQGFPGELTCWLRYILDPVDGLMLEYRASTDAATVLNLTNHAYFNLAGEASGPIDQHLFLIEADHFLPVAEDLIPTGELRHVRGTAHDFTTWKAIGQDLRSSDEQILLGRGFDHCYCLPPTDGTVLRRAASVVELRSGRRLEVSTTEPGVQLHSGNVLSGRYEGLSSRAYRQSDGFCLETQHFPDAPNKPDFPSTVLRPGSDYYSATSYRFSIDPMSGSV